MLAISLWANGENIGRDITVKIGKGNIYFNNEHVKRNSKICVFTKLSDLEEIECEEFRCVGVNNISFRNCSHIEIQDGYLYFTTKEYDISAYLPIRKINELTLVTMDGVMFIADEQ